MKPKKTNPMLIMMIKRYNRLWNKYCKVDDKAGKVLTFMKKNKIKNERLSKLLNQYLDPI